MLSEGSPNVNRPACGKKIRKINKQFLYHRDPMCEADFTPPIWLLEVCLPVYCMFHTCMRLV